MTTRRELLLAGLSLAPSIRAVAYSSGEFWNDKPASEWSEKETERLLTKSPWAKQFSTEISFASMPTRDGPGPGGGTPGGRAGGAPTGGPGMGGPGVDGGPGAASGGPGGGFRIKAVVRWESAAPIREASKRQFPSDPAGCYIIGVSGLMPRGDAAGAQPRRPNERGQTEALRETSVLQRKGKDSIVPVHIDEVATDNILLFYFPNDTDPISLDDKEVIFRTKLGPIEVKARFAVKEMRYQGKLAL
jgi:hypothetical protein